MFKFIQTSSTGIVQTFGKFSRVAAPGLNFYIPFIQNICVVDNRLQQKNFQFEAFTADNVSTHLGIAVQFQVEPEDSEKAFFSMSDPYQQINAFIENVVRSEVPKITLLDLFKQQDNISNSVHNSLSDMMKKYGYKICNTLIVSVDPAFKVKEAMNQVYESEQLKIVAKNQADASYISQVRDAEADRDRKILQGQGISGQRLEILKGYEQGVDEMAQKLGITSKDVVDFVLSTQHLDAIERIGTSNNTKTIFLDHKPGSNHLSMRDEMLQANQVD